MRRHFFCCDRFIFFSSLAIDLSVSSGTTSSVQKEYDQLKRTFATAKEEFEERSKALRENLKTVYAQHSALTEEKKAWESERKRLMADLQATASSSASASASSTSSATDGTNSSATTNNPFSASASSDEVQQLRDQLKRKVWWQR